MSIFIFCFHLNYNTRKRAQNTNGKITLLLDMKLLENKNEEEHRTMIKTTE
uniref:Uncharacterized protein n=1 Tax=Heterorhabditis bacteriophora TaxID=37862 RepID=A0A1I7WQU8_HETBA